jgi:hypothetical protein
MVSFGRTTSRCPTRDGGLDLAAHSGVEMIKSRIRAVRDISIIPRQVLERRTPLLMLRFVGRFLLRFAERTFAG